MNQIWLIRHGATAGNLQRRYIGRTDEPLCSLGEQQALQLRGIISAECLFVSPMLRARQTAALVFPTMAYSVVQDLRETDFGIFEGKTAAEMENDPQYRLWVEGGCRGDIPEGEGAADCKRRCLNAFCRALASVPAEQSAAFVFHGGGIMAVLEALGRPKRDYYGWHIENGKYITGWYDGKNILTDEIGGQSTNGQSPTRSESV